MDTLVKNQVLELPTFAPELARRLFASGMPLLLAERLGVCEETRLLFLGCGDSAAAAEVAASLAGPCAGLQARALNVAEFCYYFGPAETGPSDLLVLISVRGISKMTVDCICKAKQLGMKTLLITNVAAGAAARQADGVLEMGFENRVEDWPGLKSYCASLIAALAFEMGAGAFLHGPGTPRPADWVARYGAALGNRLQEIDEQMFALAGQGWKDLDRLEFLGCGSAYGSAWFAAQKFCEIAGSLTDEYDTEDWCHIGYHLKAAGQIGTVFFLDCRAPSYGRSLETVAAARGIGRPTLVITNGPLADLPEGAAAVQMPLLEEQPAWLAPLFDYAAPAILSGYCSELRGKGKFARQLLARQQIIRRLEAARYEGGARDV